MGYKPDPVEQEEGHNDVRYAGGFGSLEVLVKA